MEDARTLAAGTLEIYDLLRISRSDPALASCIIRSANACLITPLEAIRDLERAITHIGLHSARKILIAASCVLYLLQEHCNLYGTMRLRPPRFANAWRSHPDRAVTRKHFWRGWSMISARLVVVQLPTSFQESYARLLEGGCPPIQIEKVLAGFTRCGLRGTHLAALEFSPIDC